jgi:hypothetical protein
VRHACVSPPGRRRGARWRGRGCLPGRWRGWGRGGRRNRATGVRSDSCCRVGRAAGGGGDGGGGVILEPTKENKIFSKIA